MALITCQWVAVNSTPSAFASASAASGLQCSGTRKNPRSFTFSLCIVYISRLLAEGSFLGGIFWLGCLSGLSRGNRIARFPRFPVHQLTVWGASCRHNPGPVSHVLCCPSLSPSPSLFIGHIPYSVCRKYPRSAVEVGDVRVSALPVRVSEPPNWDEPAAPGKRPATGRSTLEVALPRAEHERELTTRSCEVAHERRGQQW
jgi:hypothetical protein